MKRELLLLISGIILILIASAGFSQIPMFPETVTMGPSYTNEVYYQFSTGDTTITPRNTWDISFRTMIMTSSIITNDGSGVVLWTYPYADTSGWSTLDTNGLWEWTPMYNDPDDWENGAFCKNTTDGDTDCGWGVYNMATHFVEGDSLFVIKLVDGSFKKIWIVEKDSPNDTYLFRYANLDGSDFQEIELDCKDYYPEKDFVGFNLQTTLIVDYQPLHSTWDLLFTKYMSIQPNGEPYPVTGVLSNPAIYTKRFYPVDPEYNDWQVDPWDSSRSTIGWDWKTFSMETMTYWVSDSMVFYVKDTAERVYRLKFTAFEGSSTGNIDFGKALVSPSGINDYKPSDFRVTLFPNPATDLIRVNIESLQPLDEELSLSLVDLSGRKIIKKIFPDTEAMVLNVQSISPGIYFIQVSSGNSYATVKLIKQ